MQVATTPTLLFVVGMHRSGTSALCAALAARGVAFGDELLASMRGVNDEGFWENAELVAINEAILAAADATWYTPPVQLNTTAHDNGPALPALRRRARALLASGTAAHSLFALKDPRLCLTLPFWLSVSEELGATTRLCVIGRAPLEVAHSLARRDGFPVGYGLRLCVQYRAGIERNVPADVAQITYDDLLADPGAVMQCLAEQVSPTLAAPIDAPTPADLNGAVRGELRHQWFARSETGERTDAAARAEYAAEEAAEASAQEMPAELLDPFVSAAQLTAVVEACYPAEQLLAEMAGAQVASSQALTRVGEQHSAALATLDERDADIARLSDQHRTALATIDERDTQITALSALHRAALATIDERDGQIADLDARLSRLGREHSHALEVIDERDAQVAQLNDRLEYLYGLPAVGRLLRRLNTDA